MTVSEYEDGFCVETAGTRASILVTVAGPFETRAEAERWIDKQVGAIPPQ